MNHSIEDIQAPAAYRIRGFPIWLFEHWRRQGFDHSKIMEFAPDVTLDDLNAARAYCTEHHAEIEAELKKRTEGPPGAKTWISKTPGVCGGSACIRNTRIAVRTVIRWHELGGFLNGEIYEAIPDLTKDDAALALEYYESHKDEIDEEIRRNEALMEF